MTSSFQKPSRNSIHFLDKTDCKWLDKPVVEGISIFEMDGARCGDEDQFFSEIADAMSFSNGRGSNWNAFNETITSFCWDNSDGCILIVRNAPIFWKKNSDIAGMLVSQWLDANGGWFHEKIPFHLIFVV